MRKTQQSITTILTMTLYLSFSYSITMYMLLTYNNVHVGSQVSGIQPMQVCNSYNIFCYSSSCSHCSNYITFLIAVLLKLLFDATCGLVENQGWHGHFHLWNTVTKVILSYHSNCYLPFWCNLQNTLQQQSSFQCLEG